MDVEANNIEDNSVPLLVNCVGYVSLDKPFRSQNTRNDYYIQFMDKGALKLYPSGSPETFSAGQFIIYRRRTFYEYELRDGGTMGYYWAHFTGSYVENIVKNAGIEFNKVYSIGEHSSPKRAFANLFQEFIMRELGFEDSCAALISRLIVELGRYAAAGTTQNTPMKSRLTQSLSYIHGNYTSDIKVGDLAEMEHLSVSRFRDVFHTITGMSPIEYIISLRIQRACEMLTTTDYTVTQISSICGYSDVLYFIRLFKQKTGVTPGSYR